MIRLSLPRLMRHSKRAILIFLAALVLATVAVPVASFADDDLAGVHLDRPLDGVGDSPLVP